MSQPSSFGRILTIIIVLVLIVFAAAWLMNRHDHRTPEQKLDAAVSSGISDVSSATSKLTDDGKAASSTDSAIENAGTAISKAGVAASSAVSVAGEKASVAMSETSADIKAAVDKQKQQNRAQARKTDSASSSEKGD